MEHSGEIYNDLALFIGGFSNTEVQGLEANDLQYISTEAIGALPPNKFKLLSTEIIRQLDTEQAQSVTDEQKAQLSPDQRKALETAEESGDGDGDGDGGDNTGGGGDNNGGGVDPDNGKCFVLATDLDSPIKAVVYQYNQVWFTYQSFCDHSRNFA
jgi:hypothetical protein